MNYNQNSIRKFFYGGGCPATMALVAINVMAFFTGAVVQVNNPFRYLVFTTTAWPERFWTLFTWPLVGGGHPIWLLFACAWAYWVCGSLERSWGTRTFLAFFFGSICSMRS